MPGLGRRESPMLGPGEEMHRVCCWSVVSRVRLWDPRDCSTPGFPVHHQLPELAQTPVRCICDAIQPSRALLPPSLFTFSLSRPPRKD